MTDTREHMNWLDDDLASRTVADRVAMYKKYLGAGFAGYYVEHERVRRVVDRDGDGRADAATVFADGFNDPAAGIGAGRAGPQGGRLVRLHPLALEAPRQRRRRPRRSPRAAAPGLRRARRLPRATTCTACGSGPTGGSISASATAGSTSRRSTTASSPCPTPARCSAATRTAPSSRSSPRGLRNPQELAFDEFGNLFTGDNNSDSGDKARWVYLVEGGDSGWRIGYQFIAGPISRGPWNEEKLWYPAFDGQAAYIVPPIANIADGPSGLAYDPGVSLLPDAYRKHFFLVDFRGASGQSGIRSFALRPKGASFELVDSKQFVWSTLATDADFGPDGALYFSDWVEGWDKPNKGRLYRVLDPSRRRDPKVREVKRLLAEGMDDRPNDELARLLAHPDMRVRQEAQFALAARGEAWLRGDGEGYAAAIAIPTVATVARRRPGRDPGPAGSPRRRRPPGAAARDLGAGPARPHPGSTAIAQPVGGPRPAARRSRGRGPRPGRQGAGRGPRGEGRSTG